MSDARGPVLEVSTAHEKLWLARCGMVLLILAVVTMVTGGILAESLRNDAWAALGGGLGFIFWVAGATMGIVARNTFAGKLVMWIGGGLLVFVIFMAMVWYLVGTVP